GAKYDPENRPYIVLDWDNTSIFNDCAHNLFVYQIDRVAFKLTPKEFSKIIRKGITFPRKPFPAEYRNQNGRAITPEMICRDLESHYEYLFENFKVNAASRVVEKDLIIMHKGDIFQDFKAKMIFYFSALHEAYPPRASYEWALFSFVNYTPAEVRAFAEYGHSYNLRLPLKMVTVSSPSDFTTKTGPVSVSYKQGITLQDGIKDLIRTAQANKIDMMVCSTSLESVVKAIACNPKYGYGIPEENIIGMRLALTDGKLMAKYRDNYEFNYREGK
ncbi:MAG: haloacid dehalogenase-like hydrolase, partial [bacterium]|nr:haloacid dehalogenase-like hydrolase [bacterium]